MNNDDFENDFDAVIMAVQGTNDYDVSMWWLEAIRIIAQSKYPKLTCEFNDVIEHLSTAIHKWKNQNTR
jgi:hypothetical protein